MRKYVKVGRILRMSRRRGLFVFFWTAFLLAVFWYDSSFGLLESRRDEGGATQIYQRHSSGNARSGSSKRNSGVIRVCSFNLKNYLSTDRIVEGVWRRNYPKPESEKRAIAEILLDIDADVLLLQEIGSLEHLEELMDLLSAKGLCYRFYALSTGSDYERHLAVVSKISIRSVFCEKNVAFECGSERKISPRGILVAEFSLPKSGVWFAGTLHLKSKFGAKKADGEFNAYRSAELAALLKRASKITGENPSLFGGDFNDEPFKPHIAKILGEFRLFYLKGKDPRGNPYSYFWKKNSQNYVYDFFVCGKSMLNSVSDCRIYGINQRASDHSAIYVDRKCPSGEVLKNN